MILYVVFWLEFCNYLSIIDIICRVLTGILQLFKHNWYYKLFWLEFCNYLSNKTQRDDYIQNMTRPVYMKTCTFMTTSHSFLLRMINGTNKSCRKNQNTQFVTSNFFFLSFENRAVYKVMWKNITETDRTQ